jgi:hypothetical protein
VLRLAQHLAHAIAAQTLLDTKAMARAKPSINSQTNSYIMEAIVKPQNILVIF